MMNDCPNGELRDLLPDFLHGRLTAADRATVEAHLATCEDCRAELALLGELRGALRRAPAVDVSAIVAAIPAYSTPVRRSWGGWRAAAAVALIAVGGTSVAIANRTGMQAGVQPPSSNPPVAVTAPDSHSTPAQPPSSGRVATSAAPRELAVTGAVSDLSDQELSTLLDGIESLDVLPSADVENGITVTPVPPTGADKGAS